MTASSGSPGFSGDRALLQRIEVLATDLAREAGAQAAESLRRAVAVEYKPDARGRESVYNPVSEVDHAIEALLRERVGETFPDHAVVGEEVDSHPEADAEWIWVVDPVDGTANFVNGFPLFAVSIGVLHRGRPVVGAVWCATTHLLHPGVYHAREGGSLYLDDIELPGERETKVRRALAGAPGGSPAGNRAWDHRVTGSTAIEITFVAAGVFVSSSFRSPLIWDVAGGIALVWAAGREVWTRSPQGWRRFDRFDTPAQLPRHVKAQRAPSVRDWRGAIVVGTPEATEAVRARWPELPPWRRLVRAVRKR